MVDDNSTLIKMHDVRGKLSAEQEYCISEFIVNAGDQIALLGKSGSGKSTLLNLLSGMISANQGSVVINNQELVGLTEAKRDLIRRDHIGMVFQTYQLLPEFSVLENVLMSALFSSKNSSAEGEANMLLEKVGLEELKNRPIGALSVGQQQRVAIARALLNSPPILLADEPTGALDHDTGSQVCTLLQRLCRESNSALIFVTHDRGLASQFPKQFEVSDLLEWNTKPPLQT